MDDVDILIYMEECGYPVTLYKDNTLFWIEDEGVLTHDEVTDWNPLDNNHRPITGIEKALYHNQIKRLQEYIHNTSY